MADKTNKIVDTWRPSRIRAISKGELYWTEVDIIDISDTSTAIAVRHGLEPFGIKVNYFPISLAAHLKKTLGKDGLARAPYTIICAHGADTEGDLSFGEKLDGELAATQDFSGTITPADFEKFVDVTDKTVINLACESGASRLADAFVKKGGANAYIADTGAPFGYASIIFPILVFYFLTNYPDLTLEAAFEQAKAADADEFKTWQLIRTQV